MGFLQDIRDLQQQADGVVAPKDAQYLDLHDHEGITETDAARCSDPVDDEQPTGEPRPTG